MTTYGVLGVGALGRAIVTGLCAGVAEPPPVVVSPRSAATASALAGELPTVSVGADNQAVLDSSDVVVVCLRGQLAPLLGELAWRPEHVVVSAMPGAGVARLAELVAPATRVARAIPMPAVATRSTTTMVHPPLPEVVALFDRLGGTVPLADEAAFTALYTASGTVAPVFAYLAMLVDWLVGEGVPVEVANRQVGSIFGGVVPTPDVAAAQGFDELVKEYATPGGVNEQVTTLMRDAGVFGEMRGAVDAVHRRLTAR